VPVADGNFLVVFPGAKWAYTGSWIASDCLKKDSWEERTMQADTEVRSRYLALALDARKVIDPLMSYFETGESTDQLIESVQEAAESLRSIVDPAQFLNPPHSKLAFEHYEQVVMLEEVRPSKDRGELLNDLNSLLLPTDNDNVTNKKEAAYRVIEFFFAVETRALKYYARPPIAQGTDELLACRPT
jgi:hypothetical protein